MNYYTAPMEASPTESGVRRTSAGSGHPARLPAIMPLHLPAREPGCLSKRRWQSWIRQRTPVHRSSPSCWPKTALWPLDDRRAAEDGLHRSQPQLRLPLRHCHRQRQGCRDAARPLEARSLSRRSLLAGRRPISVKTRLGVTSPEEFEAILDLYDRCPICELTVHPRVMRQLYRGEADRAAFANYLPTAGCPSATTATSPHRPS